MTVYANAGVVSKESLLVIPCFQRSRCDLRSTFVCHCCCQSVLIRYYMTSSPLLSHWGDQEAQEKDRLLEQVFTLFYAPFYLRLSAPTLNTLLRVIVFAGSL